VDPVLDQTPDLPLVAPLAPPLVVDPVLDHSSDLPLTALPVDSSVSPQEPASPMDPVTNQTPPLSFCQSSPAHLRDYSCFSTVFSFHEPHTYREACTNRLWQ
jgi:hypothetical protein